MKRFFMDKYDITFICKRGNDHFAQPILKQLEKKYKIQYIYPLHKRDLKVRGKIIWVEWANKFAFLVAKKKWLNKKVFIRLHRNEILSRYMPKINWENIDQIIFVNSNFEKKFIKEINSSTKTKTIPNAIDIESFPIHKNNYKKSILAYGYTFNPIKGYDSLINMFNKLVRIDNDFTLTIMGMVTNQSSSKRHLKQIKKQIRKMDLTDNVFIIEKEKVNSLVEDRKNISNFLHHYDIIMSYSNTESFHYSFAEGLLSGLEGFYNMWHNPLIKEFWKQFGYDSEQNLICGILNWSKLSQKQKMLKALTNREFVANNFSDRVISKKYENIFFNMD